MADPVLDSLPAIRGAIAKARTDADDARRYTMETGRHTSCDLADAIDALGAAVDAIAVYLRKHHNA